MLKRVLAVASFGAALFLWPSCGSDPEEAQKQSVFAYLRGELDGTWKGTTPSNEVVTLTFDLGSADSTQVVVRECASRGLLPAAWACVPTYELPVTAKIASTNGPYRGDVSGKATATGVASGVNLNLTGATTVYAYAKGPEMSANVGTTSAVPIDFERH